MNRIDLRYQLWLFGLLVVMQVPLLYKYILFDVAFGFIYVGFLAFIPFRTPPTIQLSIGFLIGLVMDIFSNTPGMHASASVLIMFVKDYWLVFVAEDPEEEVNTSVVTLGSIPSFLYLLPLILTHHLIIFSVEYGRIAGFGNVFFKIIWSALLSFVTIYIINFLIAPRKRRA
jgi:hypothetical protein